MSESQRGRYDNRFISMSKYLDIGGKLIQHHFYTRYMAPKTEMWFFGVGLGDQASMQQMGDAFLELVDRDGDPCLGRIMISHGSTATSVYPYKGDWNLWHAWGDRPDWVEHYLSRVTVQPDLCLCISKKMEDHLKKYGLETFYSPLATGRFFKPLGLERRGLGYAGNPIKSKAQMDAIVNPIRDRPDFEWHGGKASDEWWTLERLNEWYNTKQIVFGMVNEYNVEYGFLSNRVFETLASGTPFISYAHHGFEETLGYPYPYQSTSGEETSTLVDEILGDYPKHLERFQRYSEDIRENHNCVKRLEALFERLAE